MKEIILTQNKIALVDDEDFERLNQYRWHANFCQGNFYAIRDIYKGTEFITGKHILQRISMASTILNTAEMVDHINHETLDNQKYNLRICTVITNARNRRPYKNGTSNYKGVSFCKSSNTWRADIRLRDIYNNSFLKYLGLFEDEIIAAKAYDKVAKEEFGEFAYLNFKE